MPRGDGTGPMGRGPLTGRGMGYCSGYVAPGYINGCCMGRGHGYRNMVHMTGMPGWARYGGFTNTVSNPATDRASSGMDEQEVLRSQAEFLEDRLAQVRKRLKETDNE